MIRLECRTGGHNKFYEFDLVRTNGHVKVMGYYGAIGQAPKETLIYDGDSEAEARKELDKKQNEKLRKGYVVVEGNGVSASQPNPSNDTVPAIWPMNAQGVASDDSLRRLLTDENYVAQEKLDGMRAVVHITNNGLRIFSRNAGVADPSRPLEKTSSLPHLATLQFPPLVGTILDCEILAPGHDSATIAGMVNSKNGSNGAVHIYAFDVLAYCGTSWTGRIQGQRLSTLKFIEPLLKSPYVHLLPWYTTAKEKQQLYDKVMTTNAEGLMFKNLRATYLQGGRPNNVWLKFKKSATFDCVVIGFTRGAGKFNNRIGALRFGQYVNGELVELGQASGMTDALREHMSLHQREYIGKVVTIKGQERLKSGAIRHPQFISLRPDKKPSCCVWYPNEQ